MAPGSAGGSGFNPASPTVSDLLVQVGKAEVLGVGADLVFLPEFEASLNLPGSTFGSVFSVMELQCARRRPHPVASLGARWAAKEAAVKAWSAAVFGQAPAVDPDRFPWAEVRVVGDLWGRPRLEFSPELSSRVLSSLPGHPAAVDWHLSLSHEGEYALAFVVLCKSNLNGKV